MLAEETKLQIVTVVYSARKRTQEQTEEIMLRICLPDWGVQTGTPTLASQSNMTLCAIVLLYSHSGVTTLH